MSSESQQTNLLHDHIATPKAQETDLQRRCDHLQQLYENAPLAYQTIDENGYVVEVNRTWLEKLGYEQHEVIGRRFSDFLHPDQRDQSGQQLSDERLPEEGTDIEFEMLKKDGSSCVVSMHCTVVRDTLRDSRKTLCLFADISRKKLLRKNHEIERRLLHICNISRTIDELLQSLTVFMQEETRCDAVGIRLRRGDDFPYHEIRGFPEAFVKAESSLCASDSQGKVLRDDIGNPVLECMCGNILQGRFNSDLPFFTPNGSFWTNSTTQLLANAGETDLMNRSRNRCNGEGYESVALIPLKVGKTIYGLFQFNDHRRGRFSPEIIGQLEELITFVAIAVAKHLADEEQHLLEKKYRFLFEHAQEAINIAQDGYLILINPAGIKLIGYSEEKLKSTPMLKFVHPDDRKMILNFHRRRLRGEEIPSSYSFRAICRDGTIKWLEQNSSLILWQGKPASLNFLTDITQRKKDEEALRDSLAEKEVLLREVHHRVKNNLAAVIGILELQRQSIDEPEALNVLNELSSRVRAMSLVHEKLYRSESLSKIDFQEYLDSFISHLRTSFGSHHIRCRVNARGVTLPLDLAMPCGMIINELVTNALKYAFPKEQLKDGSNKCQISVSLSQKDGIFTLTVADTGIGLPPGFDWTTAKTLGLVLVRMLGQHQLGGTYTIGETGGTRFTLTFPAAGTR